MFTRSSHVVHVFVAHVQPHVDANNILHHLIRWMTNPLFVQSNCYLIELCFVFRFHDGTFFSCQVGWVIDCMKVLQNLDASCVGFDGN